MFDVHEEFIGSCIQRVVWQRKKEQLAATILNCAARIFLNRDPDALAHLQHKFEYAVLKHRYHSQKVRVDVAGICVLVR